MIKRLRRKFILINLLLVGLVLAVVFILFVGANVRRLAGQSDAALRLALSWQEGEGPPRFEIGGPPPEEREPDGAPRPGRAGARPELYLREVAVEPRA